MALINCVERMRGRDDSNPEDLRESGLEARGVIFVEVREPYETEWGLRVSTKLRMGNTGTSGGGTEGARSQGGDLFCKLHRRLRNIF
jgi:hypothetical protein